VLIRTWYSVDREMEEVWKIMDEYEILYSIRFENLIVDLLKASQWNARIKQREVANHFLTKNK
jgi:hypothetical protein